MTPVTAPEHGSCDETRLTAQSSELAQAQTRTGEINLGLGQPSPRLLPLHLLRDAAARQLAAGADPLVLQYGAIQGPVGFRTALAGLLERRTGVHADASQLAVTGGTSSALSFVAQLFARPGATVVCSDPTYFLAHGIFEGQGLQTFGIPLDHHGLRVDVLEDALVAGKVRPAFVYAIPSFHNPTGVTLSADRASHLVQLAELYDFIVVADEPYPMLRGDGPTPPVMMSYDGGSERVLSLGSFSKILGPGLRLGWLHAAPGLVQRFCEHGALRSGGGLNPVITSLVHDLIASGELERHIDALRAVFTERRQALREALHEAFPDLEFTVEDGGYFVWLRFPEPIDTDALLENAESFGVRFTPGNRCAVSTDLRRCLRLSFAFYEPHELREGVARLASLVATHGSR